MAMLELMLVLVDRTGKEVKRVTSTSGEVEDPEQENGENGSENTTGGNTSNGGTQNQGGNTGGNTGGGGGNGDYISDED